MLRRSILALSLCACSAATADDPAPPESTGTFVPPSPLGCSNAKSYDYCFAFAHGTPLAVHVTLPAPTPADAVGTVHFHREDGAPEAVLDDVSFALPPSRKELVFYFQVYPATYAIAVDVDGAHATTDPLAIGDAPVATSIVLTTEE
ncbi:MAG TPA: hypothetical protein VIF62_32170 [Labilithrix sp.]